MLKNGFSAYLLLWHTRIQKIAQIREIQVWLEQLSEHISYLSKIF